MLSKIYTATIHGIEGQLITVETDVSNGLPGFYLVGQADNGIKEAKDRIRASIINSDFEYPRTRITVNMSPAGIRKRGSHFDLAIAMGILASSAQVNSDRIREYCFIGELSLDGSLSRTDGVLPMIIAMRKCGFRNIIIPLANEEEGALIKDVNVYAAGNLMEIVNHLNDGAPLKEAEGYRIPEYEGNAGKIDFADVKGQETAKRAIIICVAGGHGLFMMGSPSSGKTMLAERIPTIMPEMNYEEILESTIIYSISGLLDKERPIIYRRPFRQPHNRITQAAFLGGGAYPKPGEISLADKGVLFLDEFGEFDRNIIENLRIPLECGKIVLNRREWSCTYPADFLLVAASNPCRCGYYGDSTHKCKCTAAQVFNYQKKLSGPILDRIDMNLFLTPVSYDEFESEKSTSSEEMRREIIKARRIQKERFSMDGIMLNHEMDGKLLERYVPVNSPEINEFLGNAYRNLKLNPRTMQKIRRVARTIADLDGSESVKLEHFAESLAYRGEKQWSEY